MEDERILELFEARDQAAIRETQEKYGRYCARIASNLLRDPRDAEECVQDALTGAWNAIPPERPRVLQAYLGKLTRSAALNRLRARLAQKRGGGERPASLEELEECVPDRVRVEDRLEAQELAEAVNAFLDGLPETDRRIFLRRYWYFDDVRSIAARFGFTQSKVKMTLKHRRDELAQALRKEGYII